MRKLLAAFTAENALLIRQGRKIQTRRTHKLEEVNKNPDYWAVTPTMDKNVMAFVDKEAMASGRLSEVTRVKPSFLVDDLIGVKETVYLPPPITPKMLRDGADTWPEVYYRIDLDQADIERLKEWGWKVKTSRFMNKEYARTWRRITSVRAERLQDISEEDALAEGVVREYGKYNIAPYRSYVHKGINAGRSTARAAFMDLWNAINLKTFPWSSNPWVLVYEFEEVQE